MKPKRRELLYCKGKHICVHGSDYHFAMSLSCTMRNVEQNARICLLMGTWLEIGYLLDIIHVNDVILCGDDRFILCADDHLSASFARLYALGQITAQFIFVSITPQFAGIGTPVIMRCLWIVPLCRLWPIVDCFRLLVRYMSQTTIYSAYSFKLRGDIRKKHLLGILLKCSPSPGPDHMHNCSPVRYLGIYHGGWILADCEKFVKHSIRSDFDPCSSWPISEMDEGHAWLSCSKKLSIEVALPSLASNVETREESTICLQRCDLFLGSWPLFCLRCTEQRQFNLWHNVTQWFLGCTFQPLIHKFTELTLTDLFHCVYSLYRICVHKDLCV